MEVYFVDRSDGGVDARVAGDDSLFNEVFADSINAIAPAGSPEPGAPSTYWLDRTRASALAANEDPSANPIAHGNVTIVTVENGRVVARFDFDPDDEPGEWVPVGQFIDVLDLWREKVLARSPSASENHPTGRVWAVGNTSLPRTSGR